MRSSLLAFRFRIRSGMIDRAVPRALGPGTSRTTPVAGHARNPSIITLAILISAVIAPVSHATAQWAVTVGSGGQASTTSSPFALSASDPTEFRSIGRNDNLGGYLRLERRTGTAWNYGVAVNIASVDYFVETRDATTFMPGPGLGFTQQGSGTVTTLLAQVGHLLTPLSWRTRVELVGGAGLIHLSGLRDANPDERTSGLRPAFDIGVAVTQELTSVVGIQAGYSALYYRSPTNQAGFAPSRGMKDLRVNLGLRFKLR